MVKVILAKVMAVAVDITAADTRNHVSRKEFREKQTKCKRRKLPPFLFYIIWFKLTFEAVHDILNFQAFRHFIIWMHWACMREYLRRIPDRRRR